jgi:hypothetical protein
LGTAFVAACDPAVADTVAILFVSYQLSSLLIIKILTWPLPNSNRPLSKKIPSNRHFAVKGVQGGGCIFTLINLPPPYLKY